MRILFSATPAYGHLLPLVPLVRAAGAGGHAVAALTSGGVHDVVADELPGVPMLSAGPMPLEFSTAAAERTGGDMFHPTPELIGEIFGGSRLDLSIGEALPLARDWAPDLVVSEAFDTVGPLVAAALGIDWHQAAIGPALPAPISGALTAVAARRYAERGLVPAPARSYLDNCPALLQDPDWVPVFPRRPVRTQPHDREDYPWTAPSFADPGRPRVLVTLGTIFSEPQLLRDVAATVAGTGVNALVTRGFSLVDSPGDGAGAAEAPSSEMDEAESDGAVRDVPFVPIARLLEGAAAVVGVGGAGTILAALARGIPMVLWPQGAEQPINAARAEAAGAAAVVGAMEEIPAALTAVLTEEKYRSSASQAAAEIAAFPSPDQVIGDITSSAPNVSVAR